MYYEHFGLNQPPFRITPDTRHFFTGGNRGAILDAIVYAITSGEGITKVVGEVGSGKTMLCRMLQLRLPESVDVVYLANPSLSPDNILHAIAFEMKLPIAEDANRLQVMQALQNRLVEQHALNRQVVIFLEEAQGMPIDTLEEIRFLSNLETEHYKLLQIVLFGQPELEENLSEPHIRQLRERITNSFSLPPFSLEEVGEYLDFRMRTAGYTGPHVFTPNAVKQITRHAKGMIRRLNILADKSLLAAFASGSYQVTPKQVKMALKDTEFGRSESTPLGGRAAVAAGVVAALLLASGFALHSHDAQFEEALPSAGIAAPRAELHSAPAEVEPPPRKPQPVTPEPEPVAEDSSPVLQEMVPQQAPAAELGERAEPVEVPVIEGGGVAIPDAPVATAGAEAQPQHTAESGEVTSAMESGLVPTEPPLTVDASEMMSVAMVVTRPKEMQGEGSGVEVRSSPSIAADVSPPSRKRTGEEEVTQQGYTKRRMNETDHWLDQAEESHYTLQLMSLSPTSGAGLKPYLEEHGLGDELDRIYVYETMVGERMVLGILFNEFSTFTEAGQALGNLSDELQKSSPFVVKIDSLLGNRRGKR